MGDSSDGDDGSFGIPLPVTVAVTLILCVTVVTIVTVFLGYPLIRAAAVTPPFFYPKRSAG